jgi:hypothetical protein
MQGNPRGSSQVSLGFKAVELQSGPIHGSMGTGMGSSEEMLGLTQCLAAKRMEKELQKPTIVGWLVGWQ